MIVCMGVWVGPRTLAVGYRLGLWRMLSLQVGLRLNNISYESAELPDKAQDSLLGKVSTGLEILYPLSAATFSPCFPNPNLAPGLGCSGTSGESEY
jgi:hypothetical protein